VASRSAVGRMDYMAHGHGKAAMRRPPEASPTLSSSGRTHGLFCNSEISAKTKNLRFGQPPPCETGLEPFSLACLRDCRGRPVRNVPVRRNRCEDQEDTENTGQSREYVTHIHKGTLRYTHSPFGSNYRPRKGRSQPPFVLPGLPDS